MISARSYRIYNSAIANKNGKNHSNEASHKNGSGKDQTVEVYDWVDDICNNSWELGEKDILESSNDDNTGYAGYILVSPKKLKEAPKPLSDKIKILQNVVVSDFNFKMCSSTVKQAPNDNDDCVSPNDTDEEDRDDDVKDKDFNVDEYVDQNDDSSETDCESDDASEGLVDTEKKKLASSNIHNIESSCVLPLAEKIKEKRKTEQKVVQCKYCSNDIATLNFARHLQRRHVEEKEVMDIMQFPKNSKARREGFSLLRNDTNFDLYMTGVLRPNRQRKKVFDKNIEYYPCAYCKGLFVKNYLKRHAKFCIAQSVNKTQSDNKQQSRVNHISHSQTAIACAMDATGTISKLNVKEQVFSLMKGDEIALEAKKDLLIVHFGDSYLKKHKRQRMAYACSNRMRELSRLLITYRNLANNQGVTLKELFHPKNFDMIVSSARIISGYDPITKTFKAASLAMHLGTSLKIASDELTHLILKESRGFRCKSPVDTDECLKNVKKFKKLVESRWTIELSSLANKHLQEKRWNKPLLVPLVSDVKLFREECLKMAANCITLFQDKKDKIQTYKLLVNCCLAMLIVFNRRRIGDVQFLKIDDYNQDKRTDFVDFEGALSDTEKMLTKKYRRVVNGGKGSRAVVILVPEIIQNFITVLLQHRERYVSPDNEYMFAIPGSTIKWGKGDVAIRTLAKKINLKQPQAFSSNKLRKHIATVMQLLNLSQDEVKQFSTFMGHTQKTHEEFYELPIDLYQTAKVSKLLLMMEKGSVPVKYKGKSLADINIDVNLEYAEEDENNDDGLISEAQIHEPSLVDSELVSNGSASSAYDNKTNLPANLPTCSQRYKGKHKHILNDDKSSDEELPCKKRSLKKNDDKSSDDEELPGKKRPLKKRWSTKEVELLRREFSTCIQKNTYPSGVKIKEFIKKTRSTRTIPVIKSKLQHLMKLAT